VAVALVTALALVAVLLAGALRADGTSGDATAAPTEAPERAAAARPGDGPGDDPGDDPAEDPAQVPRDGWDVPGPASPVPGAAQTVPTALRVPAIDLDVPLVRLGLQPDGAVEVPRDADQAGWLSASAVPGSTGPAVLVGHVDSVDGVAVFTRLPELVAGDEVEVDLGDGSTVMYVVTGSERHDKDAFPTAAVYGPAPAPVLRLVTCGGRFDRDAGSYEDNVVVYAVLAA